MFQETMNKDYVICIFSKQLCSMDELGNLEYIEIWVQYKTIISPKQYLNLLSDRFTILKNGNEKNISMSCSNQLIC